MKTRPIAILTALLTAPIAAAVTAEEPSLAWQQSGYVEETVIVTAPRPALQEVVYADPSVDGDADLAWKQAGYVGEVVIARASRSEALAELRSVMREAARIRSELTSGPSSALGLPID